MNDGGGSSEVTVQVAAHRVHDVRVVEDVVPMLDTAKFEHMQRVATMMAATSMIPDSLRMTKVDGKDAELPSHRVVANCFMVVNQAVNWGMDPFAVSQCASLVHGRLMWEGKLVAAVIEAKLGIRLMYTFDNKPGQELGVVVAGKFEDEDEPRTIEGTVAGWHKGDKSPWAKPTDYKRQLRYRGAREWARAHAPAVMLGVLTNDETDDSYVTSASAQPRAVRNRAAVAAAIIDIPEEEIPVKLETEPKKEPATTTDAMPDHAAVVAKATAPDAAAQDSPSDDDDGWPGPKPDPTLVDELKALLSKVSGASVIRQIEATFALRIMASMPDQRDAAVALIEAAKKVKAR